MNYRVKEVADMVGISVRTLHHYDYIGLLKPASVNSAGYRLYSDDDLDRLQQVMFFKELGFSLKETREIMNSSGYDRNAALKTHRELLVKKRKRLDDIIQSLDQTLQSMGGGSTMDKRKMFTAFNMTDIEEHQKKYAEEARQKYGHTDAYKESQKKAARYTKEDWAMISEKSNAIYTRIVSLMDKSPADPQVQEAIGQWRQLITDNFYRCTPEIFRGLGDLYVNDERFTANIDKYKEGLAAYMREAMHIYCDNLE